MTCIQQIMREKSIIVLKGKSDTIMKNEVMNNLAQKNFGFFKYRNALSEKDKTEFLQNCQEVLEGDHASKLEELKLALRVAKLKACGGWKEVINPDDGMTFIYSSFEAFSEYAFGFGATRTSNLLSLSQFVYWDERTGCLLFKSSKYAEMNKSQLLEIAPLPDCQREYFRSDMTVRDMRVCKKYIDKDYLDFCDKRKADDFDILASAKAWQEQSERKKEIETAKSVDAELESASCPDEEIYSGEKARPDEEIFSEDPSENSTSEFEEPKQRFSSREDVRKFLSTYESWERHYYGNTFFDEIWKYVFKNGVALYAATCKMCTNAESESEKGLLFFFLARNAYTQKAIKISKAKLEIYLRLNEVSLLGV